MDIWHKFLKWIDHNRFTGLSIVLCAVFAIWCVGCIRTTSPFNGERVTEAQLDVQVADAQASFDKRAAAIELTVTELNADIESANTKIAAADADIAEKKELKVKLVQFGAGLVESAMTGGVSTGGLINLAITGGLGILTVGAVGDNINKNRKIRKDKEALEENITA